ncbi:MAG: YesL family protein [Solobacterium sp.]|nr:YesL family protein [Solobacterium sp.]
MNIFSYDSKFSQLFLKLSYACWLNMMWMICSLPIITIGASTTALYSVTLKIADEKESNITKQFITAFRSNFKQSTRMWLLLLLAGILIGGDFYVVLHMRSMSSGSLAIMWTLNLALLIAISIIYVVVLIYIFPLIARFENTDQAMLKNSLLIGIHYLFCTIVVAAIHFVMFYAVVTVFTPLILLGEGLCALLSSYMLINVFRVISYRPEEDEQ